MTQEVTTPTIHTATTQEVVLCQTQQATIQGAVSHLIQRVMILEAVILQTIKNVINPK